MLGSRYNKVIWSYQSHLSGVYCSALHPSLDILMAGDQDSVCRVWNMKTRAEVFVLTGHKNIHGLLYDYIGYWPTSCNRIIWYHNQTLGSCCRENYVNVNISQEVCKSIGHASLWVYFLFSFSRHIKKFHLPRGGICITCYLWSRRWLITYLSMEETMLWFHQVIMGVCGFGIIRGTQLSASADNCPVWIIG